MDGTGTKISKACEPCRRRKMKCSGEEPCCQRCQNSPTQCVYRLKPRTRIKSKKPQRSPGENSSVEGPSLTSTSTPLHNPHSDVYHSVAATNHAPQSAHSSQLFYGPSSNFAFLQQIHRNILAGPHGPHSVSEVQEGGPGLDMFMQRSIFFGTPSKEVISFTDTADLSEPPVSTIQARQFLEEFKNSYLPTMGLLSPSVIDALFRSVYDVASDCSPTPKRALLFAALAIGALGTPHTDLAELLFHRARREAFAYEEHVSLPMIQLSILLADYQLGIGRPNAAYLHMGTACRKAFAFGLHQCSLGAFSDVDAKARCNTLWSLYFLETWISLLLGRKNTMRRSDFPSQPFPEGQHVLLALCELAIIAEEAIDLLYTQRSASLRDLHATAERLYVKLRDRGHAYGIESGAAVPQETMPLAPVASLLLHSVYFHAILLAFRPFMIAESALGAGGMLHLSGELWLRQARRRATDTAQDAICVLHKIFQQSDECRRWRLNGFFFTTWCSVLFYDSLRQPAKHPHNMEYVQMALECLNSMVDDEPIRTTIQSILRIQQAVERSMSSSGTSTSVQRSDSNICPPVPLNRSCPSIQFPSLDRNVTRSTADLILFTDRNSTSDAPHESDEMEVTSGVDSFNDSFWASNYDILTTDLFNFFPTYRT